MTTLGVIGGSGLYQLEGLAEVETLSVDTPFGRPTSEVVCGRLGETKLLFIARHGQGHTLMPSEVNYRANIYALKKLGAQWCLSVSAVGSLREDYVPGQLAVPTQFIDCTKGRVNTFFGDGIVGHISFGDPMCPVLQRAVFEEAKMVAESSQSLAHSGGTYVCIEGPAFSTRAESELYRSWGADIIGMTNLPEAKLAREAEMAYSTLALITDYDCWRSSDSEVDIAELLKVLSKNTELAAQVIRGLAPKLGSLRPSKLASEALKTAILTHADMIPLKTYEKVSVLVKKYLEK